MWWALAISLILIPVFIFFENTQITNEDLVAIENLILSENSEYDSGGGKSGAPALKFRFTKSVRGFSVKNKEYKCVDNREVLRDFKKGDTVTIKIMKRDVGNFNKSDWFIQYTSIYGLMKRGKTYLSLDCRNKVATKDAKAGVKASISTAILSLLFALFIFKPKTKYQALGQFPIDPILVVLVVWVVVGLAMR